MLRNFLFSIFTILATNVIAEVENSLEINSYGSFFHTDRIPNALFFFQRIEQNDSFELRKALRNHEIDSIVLASPGGSVFEGLQMAGIIFDKQLATYVPENAKCASACSFMFFAGKQRAIDGDLGVHQFYSKDGASKEKISETQEIAQFTVSEIIGFLNEFGTHPFVYERMFQQSNMYYFKKLELEKLVTDKQDIIKTKLPKIKRFLEDFGAVIKKQKQIKKAEIKEPPVITPTKPAIKKKEESEHSPLKQMEIAEYIQAELNRLGCGAGSVDGIIGPASRRALKTFSKQYGTNFDPQSFFAKVASIKLLKSKPKGYCPEPDKKVVTAVVIQKPKIKLAKKWRGNVCGTFSNVELRIG